MNSINVIIAGGRDFEDYQYLADSCDNVLYEHKRVIVFSGNCPRGADLLGERYSAYRGRQVRRFPADWAEDGVSAGFVRNKKMAKMAGKGNILIAFWDGKSKGTENMIKHAKKYKLQIHIFRYGKSKKNKKDRRQSKSKSKLRRSN